MAPRAPRARACAHDALDGRARERTRANDGAEGGDEGAMGWREWCPELAFATTDDERAGERQRWERSRADAGPRSGCRARGAARAWRRAMDAIG